MNHARDNIPKGIQHRQRIRCLHPKGTSSRTTVYKGYALVKWLLENGHQTEAIVLHKKVKQERVMERLAALKALKAERQRADTASTNGYKK